MADLRRGSKSLIRTPFFWYYRVRNFKKSFQGFISYNRTDLNKQIHGQTFKKNCYTIIEIINCYELIKKS